MTRLGAYVVMAGLALYGTLRALEEAVRVWVERCVRSV